MPLEARATRAGRASAIASIGTAAPTAYESVRRTPSSPTSRLAAITVTAASTGPAHGHEDEPEARAEEEAAAEVAGAPPGQELQRPGDQLADTGHEQRERDEEEQRDREVAQQVVR